MQDILHALVQDLVISCYTLRSSRLKRVLCFPKNASVTQSESPVMSGVPARCSCNTPYALNWVAVKELNLSYRMIYIYIVLSIALDYSNLNSVL